MTGGFPEDIAVNPVTYETPADYIGYLNADDTWIEYDEESNTARIISVEAFVAHCRNATKSVGTFDDLNRSQAENYVFGDAENNALHFDATIARLLEENQKEYAAYSDWNSEYVSAYKEYAESADALGTDSLTRQNMYNPMYFLSEFYDGFGTSTPAKYWRIYSGIEQGDTSLTVEMNLSLALAQYNGVEDVEFETVWEQGHMMAERVGDSTHNFVSWVNSCLAP